jgi:hypothetical protein
MLKPKDRVAAPSDDAFDRIGVIDLRDEAGIPRRLGIFGRAIETDYSKHRW